MITRISSTLIVVALFCILQQELAVTQRNNLKPDREGPLKRIGKQRVGNGMGPGEGRKCVCDAIGSKSANCDRFTGRCACRLGYVGPRCDHCSLGYFNSSQASQVATGKGPATCVECGECFSSWHRSIASLKEASLSLIKRSYDLSQSLTTNLDLDELITRTRIEVRDVMKANRRSFSDLDRDIDTIGGCVLENKRNSDRLNLLSSELNSTINSLVSSKVLLAEGELNQRRLRLDLSQLSYKLELQEGAIERLDELINERYLAESVAIQERIPQGAYKLIKFHQQRSHKALSRAIKEVQQFASRISESVVKLRAESDGLRTASGQLDVIGLRILNEAVNFHQLNQSNALERESLAKLHLEPILITGPVPRFHDRLVSTQVVKMLADEASSMFENYSTSFENRTAEMAPIREIIESAKSTINSTSCSLDEFSSKLNQTLQLIGSFNSTSPLDFNQFVATTNQRIHSCLDKADAKLNAHLSDLNELKAYNAKRNVSEEVANLGIEINSYLVANLPSLIHLRSSIKSDELNEMTSLKERTNLLADRTDQLGARLTEAIEMKQAALDTSSLTRALNVQLDERLTSVAQLLGAASHEIANITGSGAQQRPAGNQSESSSGPLKSSINMTKALSNRVKQLQSKTMRRKIILRKLVGSLEKDLSSRNEINSKLLEQVADGQRGVTSYLSTMSLVDADRFKSSGSNSTSPSKERTAPGVASPGAVYDTQKVHHDGDKLDAINRNRVQTLDRQVRLINFLSEVENISLSLYQRLASTESLKGEFLENERALAAQQKMIQILSRQMDSVNSDLERKSKYYESCQQE